jgi:hypothetical protein
MQTITTIGFDIAKSVFQVHGVDAAGEVVICRQLKRRYVIAFFQQLPRCFKRGGPSACGDDAATRPRELRTHYIGGKLSSTDYVFEDVRTTRSFIDTSHGCRLSTLYLACRSYQQSKHLPAHGRLS